MGSDRLNEQNCNQSNETTKRIAIIASALIIFVIVIFIWPTPYKTEIVKTQMGNVDFVDVYKINRFTGATVVIKPQTTNKTRTAEDILMGR